MSGSLLLSPLLPALLAGCSPAFVGLTSPCTLAEGPHLLPPAVHESSGVAASVRYPGVYWTHNDSGGEPVLYAVDRRGTLLGAVRVEGARNRDWEDLALGPCGEGHCLYIGDVGDNREVREDPAVYRVPEPDPSDARTLPADRFPVRLPDGPRDIETLYVLPGERLFLATKGRNHPVELYRAPAPLPEPGEPVHLESVQELTGRSPALPRLVTGGAATADSTVVALRTYETLRFYRPDEEGRLEPLPGGLVNLRHLREPQGEAVGFLPEGGVVLTSEAGPWGERGMIAFLECGG